MEHVTGRAHSTTTTTAPQPKFHKEKDKEQRAGYNSDTTPDPQGFQARIANRAPIPVSKSSRAVKQDRTWFLGITGYLTSECLKPVVAIKNHGC